MAGKASPDDPITRLIVALREKAAGKRNTTGDFWGDWICSEAADHLEELRKANTAPEDRQVTTDMTLSEEDKAKLAAWTTRLGLKRPDPLAYLDFHFSRASGIGPSVLVTDRLSGETLDLTDYSLW